MINIFILNWNSSVEVQKCLDSILSSDYTGYRVILINNYSTKKDLTSLCHIYCRFKNIAEIYLVKNDSNLGYAGGNNTGLKFLNENNIEGDILILNPDVRISANTIDEMQKALTGRTGIVTSRTLNKNNKILFDSIKLNGFLQKNIISNEPKVATDYSQGACLLVRRSIVDETGLFDERFFMYWEDVDFSIRLKKSGWELFSVTTTSVIRNKNSLIRQPLAFYYSVRNAMLIKEKHPEIFSGFSYIIYLIRVLFITGKFITKPKLLLSVILNYFSGIRDSIHGYYFAKR